MAKNLLIILLCSEFKNNDMSLYYSNICGNYYFRKQYIFSYLLYGYIFQYNEFKVRILNEKVKTPKTTIYRCGPLIDLCRGPHIRHTGKVKAFKVIKVNNLFYFFNEILII